MKTKNQVRSHRSKSSPDTQAQTASPIPGAGARFNREALAAMRLPTNPEPSLARVLGEQWAELSKSVDICTVLQESMRAYFRDHSVASDRPLPEDYKREETLNGFREILDLQLDVFRTANLGLSGACDANPKLIPLHDARNLIHSAAMQFRAFCEGLLAIMRRSHADDLGEFTPDYFEKLECGFGELAGWIQSTFAGGLSALNEAEIEARDSVAACGGAQ
jgi:hypothetical protein